MERHLMVKMVPINAVGHLVAEPSSNLTLANSCSQPIVATPLDREEGSGVKADATSGQHLISIKIDQIADRSQLLLRFYPAPFVDMAFQS